MPRRTEPPENREYAAFCRRIARRLGERIASGDLEDLYLLQDLRQELEWQEWRAWRGLRDQGYSLNEIARVLGITRQSATERWHRMESRAQVLDPHHQ